MKKVKQVRRRKTSIIYLHIYMESRGFPGDTEVKNLPANAGDSRNSGSIPRRGRSPGGGHVNHSRILAWKIPWAEEPGGLQSMGSQRVRTEATQHACTPGI